MSFQMLREKSANDMITRTFHFDKFEKKSVHMNLKIRVSPKYIVHQLSPISESFNIYWNIYIIFAKQDPVQPCSNC